MMFIKFSYFAYAQPRTQARWILLCLPRQMMYSRKEKSITMKCNLMSLKVKVQQDLLLYFNTINLSSCPAGNPSGGFLFLLISVEAWARQRHRFLQGGKNVYEQQHYSSYNWTIMKVVKNYAACLVYVFLLFSCLLMTTIMMLMSSSPLSRSSLPSSSPALLSLPPSDSNNSEYGHPI